eukprot:symbB.v1.2.017098.t1/scaffold1319.1/size197804/3
MFKRKRHPSQTSQQVVSSNREELMFQLITVPNAKLKDAALQCLSSASVADTSASEMESLIGLLDVKGKELQSSFAYLERIMLQLNKMLTAHSLVKSRLVSRLVVVASAMAASSTIPSISVVFASSRREEEAHLDSIKVAEQWNTSEHSGETYKSDKDKVEEFTLHRAVEKLRVFYQVMLVSAFTFVLGNFVNFICDILWRVLPFGRVTEGVVSGISTFGWLFTSVAVVVLSTCPIDELDFDVFLSSRPAVCLAIGLAGLVSNGARILEFPYPRWIGTAVSFMMTLHGIIRCVSRPSSSKRAQRVCQRFLPSFCTLLEIWWLDIIVGSTVNEISLDEPNVLATDIWLSVHAVLALLLSLWMRCTKTQATLRMYAASYVTVSWGSSYHACRAVDMALGHKQFEEGRQLDIAIGAATAFSAVLLLPLLVVFALGRKRLFKQLAVWLDHYRRLQLQDGAFMAMLLDSYVVEPGQPWWLSQDELAMSSSMALTSTSFPVTQLPRSEFVMGHVKEVSVDGRSFRVQLGPSPPASLDTSQPTSSALTWQIERKQMALPWPELLKLGRKKLRCVDWAAQSAELWRPDYAGDLATGTYQLSRPVQRGEVIDYFVSHSWSDSPEQKFRALQLIADSFCRHHGRYPTFWVDKFCIDQMDLADGLRVLPVNVMSCRRVLCLCGKTFPRRLWCAWELCVLLSFTSMEQALKQLVVVSLSNSALKQLANFDCSNSSCHDPNEEYRLLRVINAIGRERFENKIRALGQLILDREMGVSKGLFVPDANGINLADSQSDLGQSRSGSVMDRDPSKENGHQQDVEEDMIEVKSLRTTHAKVALESVLRLFVRSSQCNPDPEFSMVRVRLLQACLRFLKIAGRNLQDWRQHHLRTSKVASSILVALQYEDKFALENVPDISVERTWTGRSVETLLQAFSGLDRVRARHKVAFRILSRMADVLDGHSDFVDANGSTEDQEEEWNLHERLMEEETKPWDEEKMRKNLAYLDNMEEEDRRVQQEIFTSANGAQRIELFLGGLYPSQTAKTQARVLEAAMIKEGVKLVEDSKISAAESDTEDDFDLRSESSESEAGGVLTQAAVIDMPARDFSGSKRDIMAFEDLRQTFMGRFQTSFSILFTARWDSFNHWSSIVDFGNGPAQENIVIANQGRLNSLVFEVYRNGQRYAVTCPAVLNLHETCTYLCTISEDGVMCIQSNGEIIGQCTGLPNNGGSRGYARKYLYVGKSCWPDRDMFHGRIQELKVFNGQTVDWHEVVDTVFEEGQVGFDRPFLMKELLSIKHTAKIEPKVYGADVFQAEAQQDISFEASGCALRVQGVMSSVPRHLEAL